MASHNYDSDSGVRVRRVVIRDRGLDHTFIRDRSLDRGFVRDRSPHMHWVPPPASHHTHWFNPEETQRVQAREARERSEALTREIRGYEDDLRDILDPVLRSGHLRVKVAETLGEIRRDPHLREKLAVDFLHALDCEPDTQPGVMDEWLKNESRPTVTLSGPPHGKKSGGLPSRPSSRHSDRLPTEYPSPRPPPESQGQPKFMNWADLEERELPPRASFMQNYHETMVATWKEVTINVEAFGFGFGLGGFLMKIRDWCHRKDLLAIWRSSPRKILAPAEVLKDVDLNDLDRQLFDIGKFYDGTDHYLTTVTYGSGYTGTVTLFSVEVFPPPRQSVPCTLRPVASMEEVPRVIIKKILSKGRSLPMTTLQMCRDALRWGPRDARPPAVKQLRSHSDRSHGVTKKLRQALAQIPDPDSADGVAATVPQMLAWLHVRSGVLRKVESGPAKVVGKRRRVEVTWRDGPSEARHYNPSRVKIVVLSAANCKWAKERIVWR